MPNLQIKLHDFNFSIIHPCSLNQVMITKLNRVFKNVVFGRKKGAEIAVLVQDLS